MELQNLARLNGKLLNLGLAWRQMSRRVGVCVSVCVWGGVWVPAKFYSAFKSPIMIWFTIIAGTEERGD